MDKVKSKITREVYARKRMRRERDPRRSKLFQAQFENELSIMRKLSHNHLVKVFASYTDLKYMAILMKPVAKMDLWHYMGEFLRKNHNSMLPSTAQKQFKTFFGCIASAICYIHDSGVRHKDIKPQNILLYNGKIFVTDFGIAFDFDGGDSQTVGTVRGKTSRYQSPEVAKGDSRGTASDIWSLGVTFLEMFTILREETLE